MENLFWKTEKRELKTLKLWDRNPRQITKEKFEKLKERIIKRGFHDVIKIDVDGTILSGNQRKRALQELGINEVFVMFPNRGLTEEEREKVALESNINDGEWNFDELANFNEKTLLDLGWESEELDRIFQADLGGDDFNAEEEYEKIKEPTVKNGDLFEINGHRILCGDSRNPENIKRLMNGKIAKLVFTSPPYNMNAKMYQNYQDNLKSAEYIKFNLDVINNCKKFLKGFIFWNISYNKNSRQEFIEIIYKIIKETGLSFLELIVWDKGHALPITSKEGLTRQYEDILLVGDQESINNDLELYFCGRNDERAYFNKKTQKGLTNYWRINSNKIQQDNHSACFPVALPIKGIELMTSRGDIILDPFLGSGTSLVAAQRTGRECYGVELDPVYVELTLNRIKNLIGKEPIKVGSLNGFQSNHIETQQEI